ncbi:MAG: dTMP kinase [Ignavibacteria bacterium CG22_combo_CG10-13_8_21_14_all_37_15]|nr:MAG: dTMP kinase [Ignavibacteria bacterium CG22_combo_CG10-13_8_21_14_all_37_15]
MFITFEGIDFCGKSTQVKLLKEYLERKGKTVKIIREPGGTEISEKIREILLDKKHLNLTIETEILLFSASRAQLVREVIQPYLEKDYYVLSDRFHDSTTAYQGFGREIPLAFVQQINNLAIGNAVPDLTFFIDIPTDEAERRKNKNSLVELDRIEISKNDFYERVRKGYFYLAEKEKRIIVVNGLHDISTINNEIITEVEKFEKF